VAREVEALKKIYVAPCFQVIDLIAAKTRLESKKQRDVNAGYMLSLIYKLEERKSAPI
jgi:hypothetical protein